MSVSTAQRQAIMALLNDREDRPACGATRSRNGTAWAHAGEGPCDEVAPAAAPSEAGFGLGHDLQISLRRRIAQIEPGLTVLDEGPERMVPSERCITARDREGTIVVIELRDGEADGDTIGHSLAHMGAMMTDDTPVRGVLVARDFTPCAVSAARAVPNLRLVQYGFRFHFEPVALSPL